MGGVKFMHYSDRADPLSLALARRADVIVVTGDLHGTDFAGWAAEGLTRRTAAFGVYGNHCRDGYLEDLGITNVHGRVVPLGTLTVGGFQGCPRYKPDGPYQYDDEEARLFADTFPRVDILLLHAGPLDMLDEQDRVHRGNPHLRRYVLKRQPLLVFCGHQYTNTSMEVGPTRLERTYGARLIT